MKFLRTSLLSAAVTAAVGFGGLANATLIDNFNDPFAAPGQRIETDSGTVHSEYEQTVADSILGGYRDLFIEYGGDGIARSSMQVAGGSLRFNNESGAGSIGKVTWDGEGGNGNDVLAFGLNADLIIQEGCPVLGCDRFVATVIRADAGFEYQIGVYTNAFNYSIFTANTLFAIPGGSNVEVEYLFEWFTRASGDYNEGGFEFSIEQVGMVNFTDVNALQLVLNTTNVEDVDLQLDIVGKRGVPEPGALALVGVGLLGAAVAGRRRKALKA